MSPIVAVQSPGAMGAAIGARLTEHGVRVITSLLGRSPASAQRATAAGMVPVPEAEVALADLVLSIVPPKDALALAERLRPVLDEANRKPLFVDCNAVSPETVRRIAAVIASAGCPFVDGGIIGGPPRPGDAGPRIYVSGPEAERVAELRRYGLDIRVIPGPEGAASALKMSYAGINKGMIALGAAMVLAARRAGVSEALMSELSESQRAVLGRLVLGVPDMVPKAGRWAPEMQEIADYAGRGAEAEIFQGMARFYERLAGDLNGAQEEIGALDEFFGKARQSDKG